MTETLATQEKSATSQQGRARSAPDGCTDPSGGLSDPVNARRSGRSGFGSNSVNAERSKE